MNNNNFNFEDKHGKCLCTGGVGETEIVTTETREGSGLWVRCKGCDLVMNQSGVPKEGVHDYYNLTYNSLNSFQGSITVSYTHLTLPTKA